MAESLKLLRLLGKNNGVREHDCDVRFKRWSRNMAVSCMHNAACIRP